MAHQVVVIGAGIIGACTALALAEDGCKVTLVEPEEPGGPQAASYGNGTWISPGSIIPVATPGLWRKLPALLADPSGPLVVRWKALPSHLFFLAGFLAAGSTRKRMAMIAEALAGLLAGAPAQYEMLAVKVGRVDLIKRNGLLHTFSDRAAFEAEASFWRLRREHGIRWIALDDDALRACEPQLSERYRFGVLVEDGAQCVDPGAFVAQIVATAKRSGAEQLRARALGFDFTPAGLAAVRTPEGSIPCDYAVVAAGVHSKTFALEVGDQIPLKSERAYHAVIKNPKIQPCQAVMPADGKMAINMTPAGVRIAGQVEIAGVKAAPDWRRAELLVQHAVNAFPGLGNRDDMIVDRWMGHRPSIADGLPVIGRSRFSRHVIHAFGHGHVGMTAAPRTAEIVADLVAGREPSVPIAPFSPQRFPYYHYNPLS